MKRMIDVIRIIRIKKPRGFARNFAKAPSIRTRHWKRKLHRFQNGKTEPLVR
jgi:hypothetical protein